MAALKSQIDRIKGRQRSLRELKISNSFIFKENKQEDFDRYIGDLQNDVSCKYATGIHGIVTLCNNPVFQCKYRGEPYKSMVNVPKKECKREKMVKIEGLLKP